MSRSIRVDLAALAARGRVRVDAGDLPVLVALVDGAPYAVEDACRHRRSSLLTGVVHDGVVTCPAHFWQYDLRTGARHDNVGEGLPSFPCRLLDGAVEVELPDVERPLSLREVLLAHAREGSPQHARAARPEEDA